MRVMVGKFEVQIDDEDAYLLAPRSGYNFQVQDRSTANYTRRYLKARKSPGSKSAPYFHRLILEAKEGEHVDHINGDGLDNRKCNLRLVNRSVNMANQRRPAGSSGYRGVRQSNGGRCKPWTALLTVNGRVIQSCGHPTAEAAARARDAMALEHFGSHVVLNFPVDGRPQADNAFAPALEAVS
jgi:HNH endonuclease